MSTKTYIDHTFPVILHTATPARLDEALKNNLNILIPRAKSLYERVIIQNGGNKKNYRFFKAHHMAIALLSDRVMFCLDDKNATLFLTALYCFELHGSINDEILLSILGQNFEMGGSYIFSMPRSFVQNSAQVDEEKLLNVVTDWYSYEKEKIGMNKDIITLSPKVFKNTNILVRPGYCFVIMPFSEGLKEIYEDCILQATTEAEMQCKRADDIFHNTAIMEVIWTEICSSEIVIADLTGKNPNVFYELGIAHTLGKNVIMITQSAEDVPFDLRHLRHILYTNTGRGLQDLKKQLILTINSVRGGKENVSDHG